MKNLFLLEKILGHQFHKNLIARSLYVDIPPYTPPDLPEKTPEIPRQSPLGKEFPFTGYVSRDGDIYKCGSCEHEGLVKFLMRDDPGFKAYTDYDLMPEGMLREDYYVMKVLGYVKISSFEATPLDKVLLRYGPLSSKQIDVCFPR